MRFTGVLLVIVGVIALAFGGIRYSREHTLIDVAGLRATTTEQKHLPLSRTFGGFVILGGLVLLVVPRQRLA
ncbi:MAG: hypothetical protein ABL977_11680 [Candidatus Eisenbacteria bacterium]